MSASDFRFRFAVDAILKNWDALQMVVSHGAAGPESAKIAAWMVDATVQWFGENKDLEPDEVADFLLDIIAKYYNVDVQDGSGRYIGRLICRFFSAATDTNKSDESFRNSLQKALPKCDLSVFKVTENGVQVAEADNLAKDMQELNFQDEKKQENTNNEPIVDEDGFTTVVSRRKKK